MKKINIFFSKIAQKIIPYKWEDIPVGNVLRFDTNTLPSPPRSLSSFLTQVKSNCPINEYTDPSYKRLKKLIADYENVLEGMITITNSGDEAIDVLAKTFLDPFDYFITTPPTYEMFDIQCNINKGINSEVPLVGENFRIDEEKIIKVAKRQKAKIIFLVNPNNPTGSIIPEKSIGKILENSSCIVVVDEVYREFYGKSAVPLLSKYRNLVILRSFSKFAAIAGARVGYLIADPRLTEKFESIRFPMGVSYLSYKLAEYVLKNDRVWMKKQIQMIVMEREKLKRELMKLGFYVNDSKTNFILVKIGKKATLICQRLKEKGLIVRDRSKSKYIEGCIRITVRSRKENQQLIKTLKEIL